MIVKRCFGKPSGFVPVVPCAWNFGAVSTLGILGIATFSEAFSIFGGWRLHFNVTGGFQKGRIGEVVLFRVGGGVFVGASDILGLGCWGPFDRVGSVFLREWACRIFCCG